MRARLVRWSCIVTLNGPHERAEAWEEALVWHSGLGLNNEILSSWTISFGNQSGWEHSSCNLWGRCLEGSGIEDRSR